MRQHVGVDGYLVVGDRLDESGVGAIAGLANHAGGSLHEVRKVRLEFELRTFAVQKNTRHQHAIAVARQGVPHRREDAWMPRQGQVIVATEVNGLRVRRPSVENVASSPGVLDPLTVVALDANGQELG